MNGGICHSVLDLEPKRRLTCWVQARLCDHICRGIGSGNILERRLKSGVGG
jgi:hypothetical protein